MARAINRIACLIFCGFSCNVISCSETSNTQNQYSANTNAGDNDAEFLPILKEWNILLRHEYYFILYNKKMFTFHSNKNNGSLIWMILLNSLYNLKYQRTARINSIFRMWIYIWGYFCPFNIFSERVLLLNGAHH